jgi:TIR domain
MAREVFISYSQPDNDCAFALVARLEEQGIDCWIAPRDIVPSADWAAEIMDAISSARLMILVYSANSNLSPQVRREVERAVHKQLSILTFRIENVPPSKSLEFFLSAQHWMDAFPPPREPHYARLCAYIKAQLSSEPVQRPAAANTAAAIPVVHHFDADQLRYIERCLAGYIGPLAKHLVKSAAGRAAGIEDLIARLAAELETESDRYEFSRRCRSQAPRE